MKLYDFVRKYGWEALAVVQSLPGPRPEGNVFMVDSGATNAANTADESIHGCSWETPFATLNYAISRCTASQGDVILVAPGHAETIADTGTASGTTTDELVIDKAGISIVGLGTDALRPTFTFNGATDAACVITAAPNVYISGLIFVGGLEDLANLVTVDGTSDGLTIENCEFRDGGTNILETIHQINLATGADRVTINNCRFFTTDGGSSTLANIEVATTVARLTITNCLFLGDVNTDGMIDGSGGAGSQWFIADNIMANTDAATGKCIVLHASTTGAVVRNITQAGLDGTSPLTTAGVLVAQNYYSNAAGASAALLTPATDS